MWTRILDFLRWVHKHITYRYRLENKIDGMITTQSDIERRVLRLEILQAMERKDKYTVYTLYDEYKKYNGNSYMDELFAKYKKGKK